MELLTKGKTPQKKELGQFFSGKLVAKLLSTLSKGDEVNSIIDPMCGTGDMLVQFNNKSNPTLHLTGVEIDPSVFSELETRMGRAHAHELIEGNAFATNIVSKMQPGGYDLVITNPPYVRHQTVSRSDIYGSTLGMQDIRNNLLKAIPHFTTVDECEKEFLKSIVSNLSGLSDLAVPSWILCTLLVKVGGRLAIVVPETWLNRDYAQIVKYLLLRCFQIEYIVEDANSSWFPSAQVKTILLVAKRIRDNGTIGSWSEERFIYTQLYSSAQSRDSLLGSVFPNSKYPEQEFMQVIDRAQSHKVFFDTKNILIAEFAQELLSVIEEKKWYKALHNQPPQMELTMTRLKPSSSLLTWCDFSKIKFSRLVDLGVSVSQGLRTGANNFFYLDCKSQRGNIIEVYPNKLTGVEAFQIDRKYFKEVVRKQSELPDGFALQGNSVQGLVLSLQNFALPEDIQYVHKCNPNFNAKYQEIAEPLAGYIRIASLLKNGNKVTDTFIPNLSAVKPNNRHWNPRKPDLIPRFWYMLPEFSKRHFPDLFVPRVIGSYAKTRLNTNCNYLIDANFSSIWLSDQKSQYNNYALLALFNSTWTVVAMEEYGTVMGGGALKVEATQLNQIPFPHLQTSAINELTRLGSELSLSEAPNNELIAKIDTVIISALGFVSDHSLKLAELSRIKENLLKMRTTK